MSLKPIRDLLPAVLAEIRNKEARPGVHTGSAKAVHMDGSGGSCAGHQKDHGQTKADTKHQVVEFHQTSIGYMSGRSS